MYISKEDKNPQYEFVVEALRKGIQIGVGTRDKSHITYVLLRAAVLAWIELGGGYNNGSDIKAILNDVADEFTARVTHSLKGKKEKNGDVDNPIKLPSLADIEILQKKQIIDKDGTPLKTED